MVHKVVIETQIKEIKMSRTYNRRALLDAKRKRQAKLDMIEQVVTIVAIGFGLVLLSAVAIVLAYAVGTTL